MQYIETLEDLQEQINNSVKTLCLVGDDHDRLKLSMVSDHLRLMAKDANFLFNLLRRRERKLRQEASEGRRLDAAKAEGTLPGAEVR